ncbi:GntR family transcriptional regulator, partial [Chloroflexota bacterium]
IQIIQVAWLWKLRRSKIKKRKASTQRAYYAETIVEKLREDIVSGRLRPNERLIETDIALKMDISRTPVREALKLLETQGYLSKLPNGGLIVTDHSPSQIRNLYEVREALETVALRLACQRATEEEIRRAEELHARILDAVGERDINQFIELNSAFHSQLLSACGNAQLLSLLQTFRDQYFDRRLVRVFSASEWRNMPKQHQKLLDAVRQRDQRLAGKAVREHIATALRIAMERL